MTKKVAKTKPGKVEKVMSEYKAGKLHSGKPGPGKGKVVTSKKQAVAIAMSEAKMSKKKK
jgi:predicted transcriptional regulator